MAPSAAASEPVGAAKPSFAKVAAAAVAMAPPRAAMALSPEISPKTKVSAGTPRGFMEIPPYKRPSRANEAVVVSGVLPNTERSGDKAGSASVRTGEWLDSALQSAAPPSNIKAGLSAERPQSNTLSKLVAEDNSTQVSSSSGSVKPPSDNGKSTYSVNTLLLDEQESIRPDDSASLRAVEEEDVTSPPGSLPAESRQGSDHGAGAFRDQLHHISAMNSQAQAQRGIAIPHPSPYQHMYDAAQQMASDPRAAPVDLAMPKMPHYASTLTAADQPLVTALQNPRDRLFVIKLEQILARFINESTENQLVLNESNPYLRLCGHRLANYYCLSTTQTQSHQDDLPHVKINRTPFARVPQPLLSKMINIGNESTTAPVVAPARKILRRDDGTSGANTAANSQTPSKTTSEVGGSEGSNEAQDASKGKGPLTREEREARYNARRAQLFGDSENEQNGGGAGPNEEKDNDVSRSNSAAGKKKNKGKQRNYDDDDFHSRSSFSMYYAPGPSGYNNEHSAYYTAMSASMMSANAYSSGPYSSMASGPTPPQPGSTTYSSMYPAQVPPQQFPGVHFPANGGPPVGPSPMYPNPNYGQSQNQYDLSADFQRGMSSFQNAGMPSQVTPRMGAVPMATFPGPQQNSPPMNTNPGWAPMQQPYPMQQSPFQQQGPGGRPLSAHHQGPVPGAYPYGQFPMNPMNGRPNPNQHPIPGSYNRQQFNPQSQAFVPGGRGPPGIQNNYGNVSNMGHGHNAHGHAMGTGNAYGVSPGDRANLGMQHCYNTTYNVPGPPLMVAGSNIPTPGLYAPGIPPPMHRGASQSGGGESSIAKYGTPAHLPAKPPAPAVVSSGAGGPKFGAVPGPVVVSSSSSS